MKPKISSSHLTFLSLNIEQLDKFFLFSKFLKKIFLFFLFLTAAAKAVAEGTSKFIR